MRPIPALLFLPLALAGCGETPAPPADVKPVALKCPSKLPTFGEADVPGWTRVNEKTRHRMSPIAATRCISIPEVVERGDHADAYSETFVNDTGRAAMFSEPIANPAKPQDPPSIRFPAGSVIIKVKYAAEKGGAAILRTVMIKREAGYNPACGDWEFAVTDGTGFGRTEDGKLARCMTCHEKAGKRDDHTFRRDYLRRSDAFREAEEN